ncbi:MAG TPA: Cof-type HAD-IIB family hydrolase [Longilinea sp.]|nr:Cof-type HAD-IIB family hydrolase [Longilinea sp.]
MENTPFHPIRLIAVDLDGTLFNTEHKLSVDTKKAIAETSQAGIRLILATGRNRNYVVRLLEEIGEDIPSICSGGAAIISGRANQAISERPFIVDGKGDEIVVWAEQKTAGIVVDFVSSKMAWLASDTMIEKLSVYYTNSMNMRERTLSLDTGAQDPILKISFISPYASPAWVVELEERFPGFHFVYSGFNCIDSTAPGVDKGSALRLYAETYGYLPGEIAAIGDQTNDIPMLAFAGLPIAMGNASEDVKNAAAWIAPTNEKDGAAWALRQICARNSG